MSEWKYIIVQHGSQEHPILFSDQLSHEEVAKGVLFAVDRPQRTDCVVGAGFVTITPEGPLISGRKSDSLGLGPRVLEDRIVIGGGKSIIVSAKSPNGESPLDMVPVFRPPQPAPRKSALERARGARGR